MGRLYDVVVVVNELNSVMQGKGYDFSEIDNILKDVVEPVLQEWSKDENRHYNYLSAFAVDWITENILPNYS